MARTAGIISGAIVATIGIWAIAISIWDIRAIETGQADTTTISDVIRAWNVSSGDLIAFGSLGVFGGIWCHLFWERIFLGR